MAPNKLNQLFIVVMSL